MWSIQVTIQSLIKNTRIEFIHTTEKTYPKGTLGSSLWDLGICFIRFMPSRGDQAILKANREKIT